MLETIIKQVKAEEDPIKSIDLLADAFQIAHTSTASQVKVIDQKIDDVRKAIVGNGDIEDGLAFKVNKNKDRIKSLIWGVGIICGAILVWIVNSLLGLISIGQ